MNKEGAKYFRLPLGDGPMQIGQSGVANMLRASLSKRLSFWEENMAVIDCYLKAHQV